MGILSAKLDTLLIAVGLGPEPPSKRRDSRDHRATAQAHIGIVPLIGSPRDFLSYAGAFRP